ncbi:MAG: hypothetical protein AAGI07_09895 [Bacteroidota bacterium]
MIKVYRNTKCRPYKYAYYVLVFLGIFSVQALKAQRISVRQERGEYSYKSKDSFSSYEIKYKGKITLTQDEKGIASISSGGYFKVSKTTFGNKRAIVIESNSSGELDYIYYSGRAKAEFSEEGKAWLADIMLDVVRKTGLGAEKRVSRLYDEGGAKTVLNEISEIESTSVKTIYFENLLALSRLANNEIGLIAEKIGYSISSSSQKGKLYRKYANRFLQVESAIPAFFEGVSRISSSSEIGNVLRSIIKNNKLSVATLTFLLKATRNISSGSERGSVLRTVNESFVNNETFIDAYFSSLDQINSSSEKGNVLRDLLQKNTLNASTMEKVLSSTGKISSSSEQGAVLRKAIEKGIHNDQEVQTQFFEAVNRMTSSSEKGVVLRNMLTQTTLTNESAILLFNAIKSIPSSSEMGNTLRKTFHLLNKNDKVDEVFFSTVKKISSYSEKANVLVALINENNLSTNIIIQLLEASQSISSSSEKARILIKLSDMIPNSDSEVKEAYKRAAKTISSDSEYRRVMEAVY